MNKHEEIKRFSNLSIANLLLETSRIFGDKAAFSTSLSWEDQLVTHYIFSQNLPIRVFSLDTGRLFSESYGVLNRTRERYNRNIEIFFPQAETVGKMLTEKGASSFYECIENRKECCAIRKVEPLNRALENVECWITGLRAEHSENRAELPVVDWDDQRKITKLNPLSNWTLQEVKDAIKKYNIPYNPLHDKGFVSIGCQPCTRAIAEGEDFRAGRWWWEDNSKKECGLHR